MRFRRITSILCLLTWMGVAWANPRSEAAKRPFTVADDVGLTRFGDPDYGEIDPIMFSPDGQFVVVNAERGRIDLNRPESILRVYRVKDIQYLVLHPGAAPEPSPLWTLSKSTYKDGPIITNARWLADSSGIAFLAKTTTGNNRLFLADLKTKTVDALTPGGLHVTGFDIRDRNHVVYTVLSPLICAKAAAERQSRPIVATGSSVHDLLFPESRIRHSYDLSDLWALVNGRRFQVEDKASRTPLTVYPDPEGQFSELALSPDGLSIVTTLAVETIPAEWEKLYPPEYATHPWRIKAGHQNLQAFMGVTYVKEYVLIDLTSGRVKSLTNAPEGIFSGWMLSQAAVAWSRDGRSVVLPNTFLPPSLDKKENQASRPCVAVVDLSSNEASCVVYVSRREAKEAISEPSWRFITSVSFAFGDRDRVVIEYKVPDGSGKTRYLRTDNGYWSEESSSSDSRADRRPIDISVKQGLNDPPVLVAVDLATGVSRVIWNPNPQFQDIDLGEARVIGWKDKRGRTWSGGLYKPPNFVSGHRYPLVVQTHGFINSEFVPSGMFSTAFAARELAAAGIIVLQVKDQEKGCYGTSEEASCYVDGYEAAIRQLVTDGLVDPSRVGIVGFSRTCYYVLQMLTTSAVRIHAASITDGVNFGYFQYLMAVDEDDNLIAHEADAIIGASPFRDGLQTWLKSSPEFNMDKVTSPLQIVGISLESSLSLWESYATLRYLNKPVDLIVLGDGTHVLTNPSQRMMSQGGTVDWFRFWLKAEEDSDPTKSAQYARWREMRDGVRGD